MEIFVDRGSENGRPVDLEAEAEADDDLELGALFMEYLSGCS